MNNYGYSWPLSLFVFVEISAVRLFTVWW